MSKKKKMRITNPRDRGQLFTSEESAAEMVRRGAAAYVTNNGCRLGIRLIDDVEFRRSRQGQLAMELELSVSRDRGGLFFWDGCRPGANHVPNFSKGSAFGVLVKKPGKVSAGVNPAAFNPDDMRGPFVHQKLHAPLRAKQGR